MLCRGGFASRGLSRSPTEATSDRMRVPPAGSLALS